MLDHNRYVGTAVKPMCLHTQRLSMAVVAFDFDGTLSRAGMTMQLAQRHGVEGEMAALVDEGLHGDSSFAENLRHRVSLLSGMPTADAHEAFKELRLRPGAAELLNDLRQSDITVAVITGNFETGVEMALDAAGVTVDHIVANELVLENGALTGEVTGPIVDGQKDEALDQILAAAEVPAEQAIAVGDSATDLPMLQRADTAIGLSPTGIVEDHCDEVVQSIGRLTLYFEQINVLDGR